MSPVTEVRWRFWMGDMPMPEDCTSDVMWAMYDAVKKVEDKEYAAEQIAFYEQLWREYKPLYDVEPEAYTAIMKILKESIEIFRKDLME